MVRLLLIIATGITLLYMPSCSHSQQQLPSQAIVVYGDSRSGHATHEIIVDLIGSTDPIAVFHTGDLVDEGLDRTEWDHFNEIASELIENTEFYPARGNHDLPLDTFLDNFVLPNNERWYSIELAGIHFIVLDSNYDTGEYSLQYRWLEAELKSMQNKTDFIAVVMHHPPFSTGTNIQDEKGLRHTLVPLFKAYGVDIVFSGHFHGYERLMADGIYYVVTGGGGAPLYDQVRTSTYSQVFMKAYNFCTVTIEDGQLKTSVFNTESRLIDQFVLTSGSQS